MKATDLLRRTYILNVFPFTVMYQVKFHLFSLISFGFMFYMFHERN